MSINAIFSQNVNKTSDIVYNLHTDCFRLVMIWEMVAMNPDDHVLHIYKIPNKIIFVTN